MYFYAAVRNFICENINKRRREGMSESANMLITPKWRYHINIGKVQLYFSRKLHANI